LGKTKGFFKRLTFEEREQIEILRNQHKSYSRIGMLIGRRKGCISHEIAINSVNGKYTAIEAQKLSDQRKSSLSKKGGIYRALLRKPSSNIIERIECLEDQIKILMDVIKELYGNNS
jgi:IS30 family transposase